MTRSFPETFFRIVSNSSVRPRPKVIKLFTTRIVITRVFVPGIPFKPSLMSTSKDSAYLSEASFMCSTFGLAPGFTHKHKTRLERSATNTVAYKEH